LKLAVCLEIGAHVMSVASRGGIGVRIVDFAVGQEATELKSADAVQLPIFGFDRGQNTRVDMRGQREIVIWRYLPMIGKCDLEPLAGRKADVGDEPAGRSAAPRGNAEYR